MDLDLHAMDFIQKAQFERSIYCSPTVKLTFYRSTEPYYHLITEQNVVLVVLVIQKAQFERSIYCSPTVKLTFYRSTEPYYHLITEQNVVLVVRFDAHSSRTW